MVPPYQSISAPSAIAATFLVRSKPPCLLTFNENTWLWEPPVPYPTSASGAEEIYSWDEATLSWVLVVPPEPTEPTETIVE